MGFAIFIPARLQSRRLPNKPLRLIGGKPLLQWTYERARESDAEEVFIVCDGSKELKEACLHFTDEFCGIREADNGTHRISQLKDFDKFDRVINLQCDEPFIEVDDLNRLGNVQDSIVSTLVGSQIFGCDGDRHTTKVVVDPVKHECRWFSRYYMGPYCYQHIGVYSFTPGFLKMPFKPTSISIEAKLEQLEWLERGIEIKALFTEKTPLSINTEADVLQMEPRCNPLEL